MKRVVAATVLLSCWMTQARYEEYKSKKLIFNLFIILLIILLNRRCHPLMTLKILHLQLKTEIKLILLLSVQLVLVKALY